MNVKYILTVVIKGTLFTNSKMKLKDKRRCHKFPWKKRRKNANLNKYINDVKIFACHLKTHIYRCINRESIYTDKYN